MERWAPLHWAFPPRHRPPIAPWPGCPAEPWLYKCNPSRFPGTGMLPGSIAPGCGHVRPTSDQILEAWRAWQRCTGRTDPPQRPLPGCQPPNYWGCWSHAFH